MRILRHPLLWWLLVPSLVLAAQYPYFAPGGALSCTGQCLAQTVNLGSGAFITGTLPNANLANASITLNGNVIALGASDVLALASADFANQGTTTTVLHGNAAGNPTFALVNLGSDVTSLLPFANIDPAMVPTWTGATWTWSSAEPRLLLNESDRGTDLKLWDWDVATGVACFRTRTDADGTGVNFMCATRGTTTAITNLSFGNATNNPTYSFLGTGGMTVSGDFSAANIGVTGTDIPVIGLSKSAGGSLLFNTSSTTRGSFSSSTGTLGVNFGVISAGTKFTTSGCSISATVGGSTAGTYTSGTTGTCTVTITLPTSTTGWRCNADDETTPANQQNQTAHTTTSCTISGTTVTGDVIVYSAMGF